MRVFRIETDDKHGPYCGTRDAYNMEGDSLFCGRRHPPPVNDIPLWDGLRGKRAQYHFGFATLMQLDAWFGRVRAGLREAGFAVSTYEVADELVLPGAHQVAFDLYQATLLSRTPL